MKSKHWRDSSLLFQGLKISGHALFWLFDGLVLLLTPLRRSGNRALIIRLDAIGDFVLWLDAARTLVNCYHAQGYSVILLGNKAWASWAREMGVADDVWEIDVLRFNKNPPYRWQWLRKIRKAGFKIAIQPTFSRTFLEGDSLVRASGAHERIGSAGDESNITQPVKSWGNHWYTRLIAAESMQLMELKRNAEFMRGLGFADFQAHLPAIPQAPGKRTNWLPQQPYAVLVPTASWIGRVWPIARLIDIAHRLAAHGLRIVVVGGPADRERASGLMEAMPDEAVDLVGKTTLGELAEVLRGATVVVSNETSSVHIGAAVGVPVVCVLGGGHFGRFAPYEIEVPAGNRELPICVSSPMACFVCNWHCQYPRQEGEAVKCIQDISVEKVWNAVEMVLTKQTNMHSGRKDA